MIIRIGLKHIHTKCNNCLSFLIVNGWAEGRLCIILLVSEKRQKKSINIKKEKKRRNIKCYIIFGVKTNFVLFTETLKKARTQSLPFAPPSFFVVMYIFIVSFSLDGKSRYFIGLLNLLTTLLNWSLMNLGYMDIAACRFMISPNKAFVKITAHQSIN